MNDVSALKQMGVPEEAIYYSGPDSPSIGQRVGLGSVNVYDAHYTPTIEVQQQLRARVADEDSPIS